MNDTNPHRIICLGLHEFMLTAKTKMLLPQMHETAKHLKSLITEHTAMEMAIEDALSLLDSGQVAQAFQILEEAYKSLDILEGGQ